MKNYFLILLAALAISGCGINKQAQQIKALEKCKYRIVSADQVMVGGTDLKKLFEGKDLNLENLPSLAFGFLRQDIPLKATLNVEIENPSGDDAAINEFEYKILINNQELADGNVNQQVNVPAGKSITVPVSMTVNAYPFISNKELMNEIGQFLNSRQTGEEKKGLLTLKIKPSIRVGDGLIKYPGYITINKEISSKILL